MIRSSCVRKTFLLFTGLLCGTVALLNTSRADDPAWKLRPLEYNNPGLKTDLGVGLWAWPLPMDYDNDGDYDLLVSCPDKPSNGVYYFENLSQDETETRPVFKKPVRLGRTSHNMQVSFVRGEPRILRMGLEFTRDAKTGRFNFDKGRKIYPRSNVHSGRVRGNMWRYVDFEGDGDHDLIVGVGDWSDYGWDNAYDNHGKWKNGPLHGYIYLIENRGSDSAPQYASAPQRIQAGGADIDGYGWPGLHRQMAGAASVRLCAGTSGNRTAVFGQPQNHGLRTR